MSPIGVTLDSPPVSVRPAQQTSTRESEVREDIKLGDAMRTASPACSLLLSPLSLCERVPSSPASVLLGNKYNRSKMPTFVSTQLWLVLISFPLLICTVGAMVPSWPNMPQYSWSSAQPLNDDQISYFAYTIQHAVFLAKQAVMYWPCDPYNDETFLRYFDPTEAEFAKNMFRAIANVPFDLDLTDRAALERLASDPVSYNPRFQGLSIHFLGNHPSLLPENGGPGVADGGCEDEMFDDAEKFAFMEVTSGGAVGLLSFCGKVYQDLPMLNDLLSPPDWALDTHMDQSHGRQYKFGYGGCPDFDFRDNSWMDTTGRNMLHEFFHYPGLFADVPNYAAMIPFEYENGWGETIPHVILDFQPDIDREDDGNGPSNAYGGWNAMRINQAEPLDNDGVRYKGIYNPDNYAWYATSVFWSRQCGERFDPPEDEDDYDRDRRSNPQYPF